MSTSATQGGHKEGKKETGQKYNVHMCYIGRHSEQLTVSSRPSNPINAFLLTTQIRLLLTIVRGYKLYLLTYLFIYRFVNVRGGFSMREPRDE